MFFEVNIWCVLQLLESRSRVIKTDAERELGQTATLELMSDEEDAIVDERPVLSRCTQQGGTRTRRRGRKLKIIVFNENNTGQGKADRQETPGVTSRPDLIKLNRQDYKYTGKS